MDTRWRHPELAHEPVAWLSTADGDGRPALVPVWFFWDGEAFLVASKPGARKVRNVRANPHVTLGIASVHADLRTQLVEGNAEVLDEPSAIALARLDLAKYNALLAADGLDRQSFFARYSSVIRIRPTRFLPWQGPALASKSQPASPALPPAASALRAAFVPIV